MAEKMICQNKILTSEFINNIRIASIQNAPHDAFPDPRLYFCLGLLAIEHGAYFFCFETFKNRLLNDIGKAKWIIPLSGDPQETCSEISAAFISISRAGSLDRIAYIME